MKKAIHASADSEVPVAAAAVFAALAEGGSDEEARVVEPVGVGAAVMGCHS